MTKYYGGEELDCEQLYEKADQALYYVKIMEKTRIICLNLCRKT